MHVPPWEPFGLMGNILLLFWRLLSNSWDRLCLKPSPARIMPLAFSLRDAVKSSSLTPAPHSKQGTYPEGTGFVRMHSPAPKCTDPSLPGLPTDLGRSCIQGLAWGGQTFESAKHLSNGVCPLPLLLGILRRISGMPLLGLNHALIFIYS